MTLAILRDGSIAEFRVAGDSLEDWRVIQGILHNASEESLYYRFFRAIPNVSESDVHKMFFTGSEGTASLIAFVDGRAVALGTYSPTGQGSAEVAFLVCDAFQAKGIGTLLLERLANMALGHGIHRFEAYVLEGNHKMSRVFIDSGYEVTRKYSSGIVRFTISLNETERSRSLHDMRERLAILEHDRRFPSEPVLT